MVGKGRLAPRAPEGASGRASELISPSREFCRGSGCAPASPSSWTRPIAKCLQVLATTALPGSKSGAPGSCWPWPIVWARRRLRTAGDRRLAPLGLSVRRSCRTKCPIFARRPKGENLTQSGPDASAQSVWRDGRSGRNVRQSHHVLADVIGGNKAEGWPRAGEERLAATKHDGVEVESIFINKTKVG
ncbi:MAG: hypothetical protein K0S56_4076 [Microvirga sp.]|nr:hypothetical protein [Microvirga sp.]